MLLLAWAWHIDLIGLASQDSAITRLLRGENKKALVKDVLENRSRYAMFITILLTIIVLTVALRMVGVPEDVLPFGEIFAVYALVLCITIIPLSPGGAGVTELLMISAFSALTGPEYEAAVAAGVLLYRIYFWFIPIPIAWILLKAVRRGKSMLPTTAELRSYAKGDAAADAA